MNIDKLARCFSELQSIKQSMIMDITYDKVADWVIRIVHRDSNTVIFEENDFNLDYVCSKAYIALYDWSREFIELEDVIDNM